jgi:Chalcone isomerase-like
MLRFYVVVCLVVFSLRLNAADIAGVRFPDTAVVADQPLVLNGLGVRYRTIVKVYAAALYLPQKSQSEDAVLAMAGSKRIQGVMLREVEGNTLGRLLMQGIRDNSSEAEVQKHLGSIIKLGQAFAEHTRMKSGNTFSIDFVAGRGPVLKLNDVPTVTQISDPGFNALLLRVWLGKNPVDPLLKQGLLNAPLSNKEL